MGGGGGGDLGLDGKGTLSQGKRLENAAADLDAARKLLGKDGSGGPADLLAGLFGDSRFGEYGADTAFPAFAAAWHEEVAVLAAAVRELHRKIGNGVATTGGTDESTGAGFHSMGSAAAAVLGPGGGAPSGEGHG